jgi:NAD(P)-dependent dehydrogenase (short-subunit alcohol dehydrogenase family)
MLSVRERPSLQVNGRSPAARVGASEVALDGGCYLGYELVEIHLDQRWFLDDVAGDSEAVDIDEWDKIFEVNVTGTLRGIQTCAPLIKASGGGSIVNIGSVAGITGNFGTGYSSSKWALEGLSRSAAYVFADWGIRCNVIQPGWIETDLTASMTSNPVMKRMTKHTMDNTVLLRRSGKADEIAYTALFLASDESSYITGTDIVVDGGWFSSAPYLGNERSHHMLTLLKAKEEAHDKKEQVKGFLKRFL